MSKIKEFNADELLVKIYDTRNSMGENAAKDVASKITELLTEKSEINIIFAAAPSQQEFLASLINHQEIPWNRINAFHMDEYIGLDKEAPQGFGNFLKASIFEQVNLKSVNYLNSSTFDSHAECDRYAELLIEYPTDIVCMGIGENGHIAFNDPHVAIFDDSKLVKVVELDNACRQQQVNDGCFSNIDQVPTHAMTLTIPALMSGANVFCIVPGKTKTDAVFRTLTGEISEECPASILRKKKDAILYVDSDSASAFGR
ncbi:MAG: glucosamine-6-phosphate deaminase [Saccharofermentanales bacterium]|jgi:glucosamine-6-phosphate deaminase